MAPLFLSSRRQFLCACGAALAGPLRAQVSGIDGRLRKEAEEAPLAMRFTGSTAAECRKWQGEFAARLRSLLGPHAPPPKWKATAERTARLMDHVREELVLKAEGHPPLPLHLLRPLAKAEKPRAGLVAVHGHGGFGYDPVAGKDGEPAVARAIGSANYDYGRQLVRRGYVVAVPCLTPFGRRLGVRDYGKQDPCAITFLRMQLLGKVLMAENLRDCLWAVELLARQEGRGRQTARLRRPVLRRANGLADGGPGAEDQGGRRVRGAERDAGADARALFVRGAGHPGTVEIRRRPGNRIADRPEALRLRDGLGGQTHRAEVGRRGADTHPARLQGPRRRGQPPARQIQGWPRLERASGVPAAG